MTLEEMWREVRGAAKREWWLVAVAVAVAMAVAVLAAGPRATTYQAQATFLAETGTRTAYKGVPAPDDVVRDVGAPDSLRAIASSAGVSVEEAGKVRLSGFGNPTNRVLVSYSGPSRATALAVIGAADQAVLDYVARRTGAERANYQASVDQAEVSIGEIDAALARTSLSAWERADLAYKRWQIGQAGIESQGALDALAGAYRLQAPPTVSVASTSSAVVTKALTGGLIGLILGLLLALGRELMLRRGQGTATP